MAFLTVFDLATQRSSFELMASYGGRCKRFQPRPTVLWPGRAGEWDAGGVYGGNAEPTYTPGIGDDAGHYRWAGSLPFANPKLFSKAMASDEVKLAKYLEMVDTITYNFDDTAYIIYGEQGVRWDFNETDTPAYLDDALASTEERDRYGNNNAFHFGFMDGSIWSGPFANVFYDTRQYAMMDEYKEKYEPSLEIYFSAAVLPAPDEVVATYTDDITEMYVEVADSIILGKQDISYFDACVERFLASGGQAYLDAMNELNLKFFE